MSVKKPLLYNRIGRLVRFAFSAALLTPYFSASHAQEQHPDSLAADSILAVQQPLGGMMAPMALPSPPNISYSVPSVLQVGVPVSYSPTNTGGAVYADGDVTDFVGSGVQGYLDGTGTAARFNTPSAMVLDGSGNLYVAESGNHRIRRVTPAGVVTTFAGSGVAGTADGTGTSASFNNPAGMVFDASGNLYVVDRSNHRIRRVTPAGVVTTVAGSTLGYQDGTGTAARFNAPFGIVLESSGNLLVVDQSNLRIRRVTPAGVVTTFVGSGSVGGTNGTGTAASFDYPHSICKDASGNFYVTENTGHRVRRITPAGVVTTFAGTGSAGSANGTGTSASFNRPVGISLEPTGSFLMTELHGYRIRRISSAGVVTTVAGTGSPGTENGPPLSASFNYPSGAHANASGTVYITDQLNHRVRKMGTGQGYTISPALPAGMTFNKTTGVIGGTPTSATASTTYTITAYNAGGSFPRTVTFSVASSGVFSSTQNYILKTTYLGRYASAQADPPIDSAMRDITYFDGLGRSMQEVGIKAVQAKTKDVVTPITYDGFGRQDKDYLPYATTAGVGGAYKSAAVADQATYYNAPPSGSGVSGIAPVTGTTLIPSFGQRKYEASPLNRVQEQGFPGATWQPASSRGTASGRTAVTEYATNNVTAFGTVLSTRRVSRYAVNLGTGGEPALALTGTYAAGELYVTVTKDENWQDYGASDFRTRLHTAEEYTDKQGRVVLKRMFVQNGSTNQLLSTYYVYNDLGQLSFVLTPEMGPDRTGTTAPTATELDNHAYRYRYDGRGRVIEKKIPGRGAENYVHNPMGWLVYHQDARQASETISGFTPGQYHTYQKYDGQGRLIIKGVERNRSWTREQIQAHVDSQTKFWEERSSVTGNMHGYTNVSQPQGAAVGDLDAMEVNYYDYYENIPGIPVTPPATHSKLTHGKLVASKVKVIGTSPAVYLWTVYFYDNKGNVVDTYAQHYKNGTATSNPTGNHDRTTTTYTFTGKPKLVSRKHFLNGVQEVQVNTDHVYDHRERLVDTWMQVNPTAEPRHISRNHYNEVGQVWKKELDGNSGTSLNYPITYTYNERGWLLTNNSGLFSQTLQYNTGSTKFYNGNIAYQVFSRKHTDNTTVSGTYAYTYDGVNRLLTGTMASARGREILTYDRNGNIATLRRTNEVGATVDSLLYAYTGNRLMTVNDRSVNAATEFMLRGVTTYTYDANGNVKSRNNPTVATDNITDIVYNYLNLPQTVSANGVTLTYTYDGRGRKLRSVNGINGQTRNYVDGIEYSGTTMELIHMAEGRILRSGSTYSYEYTLKDHLGNTRSALAMNVPGTSKFGMDYYPFGLEYLSKRNAGSPKNNYLYNGKELQDKIKQLDYGARFYDPVIGRWGVVDPLADIFEDVSPYNYALNNPLRYVDPDGMAATDSLTNLLSPLKPAIAPIPTTIVLPEILVTRTVRVLGPVAASASAGWALGSWISNNIHTVTTSIASLLVQLGVDPNKLYSPELNPYQLNTEGVENSQEGTEKTADELLPGSLKRSPSYNPQYGDLTRSELSDLAQKGDQVAKKMKKLVDQVPRLLDKNKNK